MVAGLHLPILVTQAGRRPHLRFRGLLRLHSRYGPLDRSAAQAAFVTSVGPHAGRSSATRPNRQLSGWNPPPLVSMVYGFVKQSGGHVSIYSRVGHGTCVKLYVPRAPSSPVRPEEGPPDVFPEDLGNKVVLVVEDEARLRRVAVKMLDRLGVRSMQAETAKDALQSNTAWPRSRRQLRTIRSSHDRLDQLSGGGADPAGLVGSGRASTVIEVVGHVLGLPPCLSPPTYKLNAEIAAPNE